MKLQNLIIIFLAIALPVIIILSVYIGLQVDTTRLKAKYNTALINSSHEAITAFEMNTTQNDVSNIADVKIREVQAALNAFSTSLVTNLGATGAVKNYAMSYIPALAFTLYDGYYIYMPSEALWNVEYKENDADELEIVGNPDWETIPTEHELKSYVHYSKQYKDKETSPNTIVTINYTLDNYVSVYYYKKVGQTKYDSRAGYLEAIPSTEAERQEFLNNLGEGEIANNARQYYTNAWEFTRWFNNTIDDVNIDEIRNLKIEDKATNKNLALPGETSAFNDEKYDVIKTSITKNLVQAMHAFGYEMPELSGTDWDLVLNNVCLIAFMQGLPCRNNSI